MASEAQWYAIPLSLFWDPLLWLAAGVVVLKQPVANDIKVVIVFQQIGR